jgi:hypothetical protein
MMKYNDIKEALAKSQYERYTKRKWDSATVQDKAVWLDGTTSEIRSLISKTPPHIIAATLSYLGILIQ